MITFQQQRFVRFFDCKIFAANLVYFSRKLSIAIELRPSVGGVVGDPGLLPLPDEPDELEPTDSGGNIAGPTPRIC